MRWSSHRSARARRGAAGRRGSNFQWKISARKFVNRSDRQFIPIDAIGREEVKLKAIPISLRWRSNGEQPSTAAMAGREGSKSKDDWQRGPTRQRPWFRQRPKVQIVPGIAWARTVDRATRQPSEWRGLHSPSLISPAQTETASCIASLVTSGNPTPNPSPPLLGLSSPPLLRFR